MSASPNLERSVVVLLAALYCAQGLPSGLIAHALPVLLRQQGLDLALIGLLKLLALPWLLKVLWAPWVDRLACQCLGHRRGWIVPLQTLVILCVVGLAWLDPAQLLGSGFWLLMGALLLINMAAATQDIATDGLAVRLLPERWRGLGNSLQVGGYKVGMLVSGSGLLLLMGTLGWRTSMLLVAALLLMTLLPMLLFNERKRLPLQIDHQASLGPALLLNAYRGLLAQPGIWAWLAIVLSFKLGDSLGSPMIKPMLVDQGWSSYALGQLTFFSSIAGIGGALLGGLLYTRLRARRALLLFGVLQAAGLAAFALLLGRGGDIALVYAVALFEQCADGMSSVALFAVMMNLCRAEHEGADFTLQASAQLILAGVVGSFSGVLAKALGYPSLFLTAAGLGVLALWWVWRAVPSPLRKSS